MPPWCRVKVARPWLSSPCPCCLPRAGGETAVRATRAPCCWCPGPGLYSVKDLFLQYFTRAVGTETLQNPPSPHMQKSKERPPPGSSGYEALRGTGQGRGGAWLPPTPPSCLPSPVPAVPSLGAASGCPGAAKSVVRERAAAGAGMSGNTSAERCLGREGLCLPGRGDGRGSCNPLGFIFLRAPVLCLWFQLVQQQQQHRALCFPWERDPLAPSSCPQPCFPWQLM